MPLGWGCEVPYPTFCKPEPKPTSEQGAVFWNGEALLVVHGGHCVKCKDVNHVSSEREFLNMLWESMSSPTFLAHLPRICSSFFGSYVTGVRPRSPTISAHVGSRSHLSP